MNQGGRLVLVLRDPLRLCDRTLSIPQELAPLLALCDGTRSPDALRASLAVRYGLSLRAEALERVLDALDQALLLENDRSIEAAIDLLAAYREADHRPPALAGESYPADADQLCRMLEGFGSSVEDDSASVLGVRGLVCPHIDYGRGGSVYARVCGRANGAIRDADLIVVLGTDHYGGEDRLTLTRQSYATPLGVLPTATEAVDAIAGALGVEGAFAEELHHRSEHSIELAVVWLLHARGGEPCEMVPVLCGSFPELTGSSPDIEESPVLTRFVDAAAQVCHGRRVLIVAAADLSHVGPAFGQRPLGLAERAELASHDQGLLRPVCAGDAQGFVEVVQATETRHNVCGVVPIYLSLRLLAPVTGDVVAYERCAADGNETSFVTICGVVWH